MKSIGLALLTLAIGPSWSAAAERTGRVVTPDGRGAAGVQVLVHAVTEDRRSSLIGLQAIFTLSAGRLLSPDPSVTTDSLGQFHFDAPGAFIVSASSAAGYAQMDQVAFSHDPRLILQPWARLTGAVMLRGKPIAGLPVTIVAGGEVIGFAVRPSVVTDATGHFAFEMVPPSAVSLYAIHSTERPVVTNPQLAKLSLAPGETRTLVVEDQSGPPATSRMPGPAGEAPPNRSRDGLWLPGAPFGLASSPDGAWIFVSLMGGQPGVAVLHRDGPGAGARLSLVGVRSLPWKPTDATVTHDGKLWIAAAIDHVIVADVDRLIRGRPDPVIASWSDGDDAGSINAAVSPDDRLLFVSEEGQASISVFDLTKIRSEGYSAAARLGAIPTGGAPIALVFSPDGRWLYTTCQIADPAWGWPSTAPRDGPGTLAERTQEPRPEGAVVVVDTAKARTDPASAVVARVPAGGTAVRAALSPSGDRLYVTVRSLNQLDVFDASRLVTDPAHALLAKIPVGPSPVPVVVLAGGARVIVGNSNRFAPDGSASFLSVIDPQRIGTPDQAVLGTIPVGAFPRELLSSPDGRTLYVSNFGSQTVQVVQLPDSGP